MPKKCENCGGSIEKDEDVTHCDNCHAAYHYDCMLDTCLKCKKST
jgi:hypothetical protein